MPTTVLATALPYSLADDAPFHLTIFITHKLTGGGALLSGYPAAADWPGTLAGCTLMLTTSLNPGTALPLRVVSAADTGSWAAVLPPGTPVATFPTPVLSGETWRTNPASRMSDHAVDLQLAAITAAPALKPGLATDPVAGGLLETLANLDERGALRRLLRDAPARSRRALQVPAQRLRDALATIGPLTDPEDADPERGHGRELPPLPPYQSEMADNPSPVQVLLDDPNADLRVTRNLDRLIGRDLSANPQLQLMVDAHAMRRYYERPEQPQQEPRTVPDPDAPPTPRPERPQHDFHAKAASFGSTPALLRRLGLAVDVVLDGVDAAGARAALAGATWVSVAISTPDADVEVLPPRRTSVLVEGPVFAARSSNAWVGGALPLGDDDWVVLDADPDASGLKLDQHVRNLARQYAGEANGDPATSAPGTLRATGFALARRNRAAQLRARVQQAEQLASDDGSRELLLDDVVRGLRVEVWDDATRQWHSLHRRRVTVTGQPGEVTVLADAADTGFLQLSALNRAPGDTTNGYYLHEVVAGWDGWSLSAPRPGLTVVHVQPPGPDGATEAVVDTPPDEPIDGAHITTRVEPGSLPRLRYGTSYSFRVLAVDLAGNSVPQVAPHHRMPPAAPGEAAVAAARTHLDRLRISYRARDRAGVAAARRAAVVEHLRSAGQASGGAAPENALPAELLSGDPDIDATLAGLVAQASAPEGRRRRSACSTTLRRHRASSRNPMTRSVSGRSCASTPPTLPAWHGTMTCNCPRKCGWPPGPRSPPPALPSVGTRSGPRPRSAPGAGNGEQPAHLVVRSGLPVGEGLPGEHPDARPAAERHIAPPKATQLEAEAAGYFDAAIGTGNAAEIRRLYAVALAERGPCWTSSCQASPTPGPRTSKPGSRSWTGPGRTPARRTGPPWLTSLPTAAGPSARASTWCTTPTPCGCLTFPTRLPPACRWCSTRRARRTDSVSPARCSPSPSRTRDRGLRCSRCGSSWSPGTRWPPASTATQSACPSRRGAGAGRALQHPGPGITG